jgi:hypothetical protein
MLRSVPLRAALLSASVALFAPPARADDPAAAQSLFNDAKKLMTAGNYAEACPKLEESQRLAPAVGTRFNLADCYEHVGRSASAWAAFLSVASSAKNASQAAREKAARDRATALEPKLSRLAVVIPPPSRAAGLAVTRDGESVGDAEWGEAMPVDPGEHTVAASAPGKHGWKAIVDVQGVPSTTKVIVPPLDDEPVAPPPASPAASSAPAPAAPAAPSSASPLGWVLIGMGGAAVVGGAVVWVMRGNEESKLDAECGPSGASCPPGSSGDISSGKTDTVLGATFFAVGGAAVLVGASLLLFGGHDAKATASARIVPALGGLRLEGSF